jgi:hypothetical protein
MGTAALEHAAYPKLNKANSLSSGTSPPRGIVPHSIQARYNSLKLPMFELASDSFWICVCLYKYKRFYTGLSQGYDAIKSWVATADGADRMYGLNAAP